MAPQTEVGKLIEAGKSALPTYSNGNKEAEAAKGQAYGLFAIAAAIQYYADTMRELSDLDNQLG